MPQAHALTPERLAAANINPSSFLATDYLNHFNEVVMLMEMVPDMPDMAAEVMDWEPLGYAEHFERSVFKEKALAIAAYRAAPSASRDRLEAVVADLDARITDAQILLAGVDPSNPMDPALADRLMTILLTEVRPAIDRASGIINATGEDRPEADAEGGEMRLRAQDAVDELFG